MTRKIKIEDTGIVELTINGSKHDIDLFIVVDELEKRIAPCREKSPDSNAWVSEVVEYIKEKYQVDVSQMAALRFHQAVAKEYEKAADFFIGKPDSSSTSELTLGGLPKARSVGDS